MLFGALEVLGEPLHIHVLPYFNLQDFSKYSQIDVYNQIFDPAFTNLLLAMNKLPAEMKFNVDASVGHLVRWCTNPRTPHYHKTLVEKFIAQGRLQFVVPSWLNNPNCNQDELLCLESLIVGKFYLEEYFHQPTTSILGGSSFSY